MQMQIFF